MTDKTGTAFDFIRIEVPCPQCGKNSLQRLTELVSSDSTECLFCHSVIDLTDKDWKSRIAQQAQEFKQIKPV